MSAAKKAEARAALGQVKKRDDHHAKSGDHSPTHKLQLDDIAFTKNGIHLLLLLVSSIGLAKKRSWSLQSFKSNFNFPRVFKIAGTG